MRTILLRPLLILAVSAIAFSACQAKKKVDLQNAPGALMGGAGKALIGLPIGTPTAGYLQSHYITFIPPPDDPGSPYASLFPATRGMESPPAAKAVLLDNGVSYMVIAKIDAVGITEVLTERVIQLAKKNIPGKYGDLEGKLILNATHTHDAGCRFSRDSVYTQLTDELGFTQDNPLGNALAHGFDTYSQQATDTVAMAVVEAIQGAVSSLQPATFGYSSTHDTESLAGHDRRCENDHIYGSGVHDDRVVVMRLDNATTGAPIAIMYNFAMHGTFYDAYNHFLSVDAPGHTEYFVEQQFDKPIIAMYIQGNAGDVSPSGGNNDGQDITNSGEGSSEDMQHAGWELSQMVMQSWNAVSNSQHVLPLQVAERWTAISYDLLGYPPGPSNLNSTTPPAPDSQYFYPYGSVLCFQLVSSDCSAMTQFTPAQIMDNSMGLGICSFAPNEAGKVVDGVPTGSKYATRVAAGRIGDLGIGVVPGEPLYGTGQLIIQGLTGGEFAGIKDAIVIGYAQDHNGYILQEDDWLSGGYEPTITFWGWRYGAYQVQQSIDVFRQMFTGKALYENVPKVLPNLEPDTYTPVVPSDSTAAPAIDSDVPSTSPRITPLTVKFHGGDPGLGTPLISLQLQVNGSYVNVTKPTPSCSDLTSSCWTSGWIPVNNQSENDFVVWYSATPTFVASPTATVREHDWTFEYEPPVNLPAGTYRFQVTGQASMSGQTTPYTLNTAPVQITPNTNLTLDMLLTPSSGQLVFDGTLLYPQLLSQFGNAYKMPGTQSACHVDGDCVGGDVCVAGDCEEAINLSWQTANFRALTPRWGVYSPPSGGTPIPFSPAVPATTIPSAMLTPPGGGETSVSLTYVTRTVPDTVYDYYHHPDQGSALHAAIPGSGTGTYTLSIPSIADAYGNTSQPTTITASM